jgi:hypothetical protein
MYASQLGNENDGKQGAWVDVTTVARLAAYFPFCVVSPHKRES